MSALGRTADARQNLNQFAAVQEKDSRALHRAIHALALTRPEFSARVVITPAQQLVMGAAAVLFVVGCAIWPSQTGHLVVAVMSIGFLVSLVLRTGLAVLGREEASDDAPLAIGRWPIYTILVPLFHEAQMLPQMLEALGSLDYPAEKLDIKLIVEENDPETVAAARVGPYEVVVVPSGSPQTKPKACNYALQFAHGEFVVVYDAEDRPQADQLRKALKAFRTHPEVSCFQARLVIDNGHCSWLARMFALDYGIWFKTLLPGLSRLGAPIPLGGTSNHFRCAHLVAAGAWDPFNVTEDADLGVRMARLGYRVSMIDSETYEEAPVRLGIWFRQRTRWMKGYMQTLLVHTRNPAVLVRGIGMRGCFVLQSFLGGAVWSALVNPLLWVVFITSILCGPGHSALDVLAWISGGALLVANILLAALSSRENNKQRPLAALFYPLFWLLISAAAYRALWQLIREPHRWEKTPHGAAEVRCVV